MLVACLVECSLVAALPEPWSVKRAGPGTNCGPGCVNRLSCLPDRVSASPSPLCSSYPR